MTKRYVTTPSENFAEREVQVGDYHPDLCRKLGRTHAAYGWAANRRGDWDDNQWQAFLEGHREARGES